MNIVSSCTGAKTFSTQLCPLSFGRQDEQFATPVRSAAEFKVQDFSGEPFPPAIDIHAPGAYLQILF
jgi:hypothetical protein